MVHFDNLEISTLTGHSKSTLGLGSQIYLAARQAAMISRDPS